MKIDRSQINRMAATRMDDFVSEMVDYVCAGHPSAVTGAAPTELRQVVRSQIAAARESGIRLRGHNKRFLDLACCLGPEFRFEAWADSILGKSGLVAAAKLHVLEKEALFRSRGRNVRLVRVQKFELDEI